MVEDDRYHDLRAVYGDDNMESIKKSQILVVGAGGIGCELLKNLVLSGYENIHVIDLDTIDISNLNRQFLFRKEHVGKSKAEIAKQSAMNFNPNCNIVAHHGNIMTDRFNVDYYKDFDVVLNALDNLAARQYVNRMCLAADVPLVDGGTAGYLGQVSTIKKGKFQCYDCYPKMRQKSYPVCTIRSNPSKTIHCVVWAKQLFDRLFGNCDEENEMADFTSIINESTANMDKQSFAEQAFDIVFSKDIIEYAKMKDESVWHTGQPPEPIQYKDILSNSNDHQFREQDVWTVEESVKQFINSSKECFMKRHSASGSQMKLEFDKDDPLALLFVVAAANCRSANFHIPLTSKYDIKGLAGSIVPAIATTNAIISGLLVLETTKIITGKIDECKSIHCVRQPCRFKRKDTLLYPVDLEPPRDSCFVCSSNEFELHCHTGEFSLQQLIDLILRGEMGMVDPVIMKGSDIIFDEGDDLDSTFIHLLHERMKKSLSDLDIHHYSQLVIEDMAQDSEWKMTIIHNGSEFSGDTATESYRISGKQERQKHPRPADDPSEETLQDGRPISKVKSSVTDSNETIIIDDDEKMDDDDEDIVILSDDE